MIKIGLTGGIGSGKSTVSFMLKEAGFNIIDADVIARDFLTGEVTSVERNLETIYSDSLSKEKNMKR